MRQMSLLDLAVAELFPACANCRLISHTNKPFLWDRKHRSSAYSSSTSIDSNVLLHKPASRDVLMKEHREDCKEIISLFQWLHKTAVNLLLPHYVLAVLKIFRKKRLSIKNMSVILVVGKMVVSLIKKNKTKHTHRRRRQQWEQYILETSKCNRSNCSCKTTH